MGTNPTDLQSNQSNSSALKQLASVIVLRCVECASPYPGVSDQPRYRCDCGGVLDVESKIQHPTHQELALQVGFEALTASESEVSTLAGMQLRQLFDERLARPTIWSHNI